MGVTVRYTNGNRPEIPDDYEGMSEKKQREIDDEICAWDKKNMFYVDLSTFQKTDKLANRLDFSYTCLYLAFVRLIAMFDITYALNLLSYVKCKRRPNQMGEQFAKLKKFVEETEFTKCEHVMTIYNKGEVGGTLTNEELKAIMSDEVFLKSTKALNDDVMLIEHEVDGFTIDTSELNANLVKETLRQFLGCCKYACDNCLNLMWS